MTGRNILTTQELAEYLKLNEKTVIRRAQSGELPGFKIGNQWRFYLSTIDEYLQDRVVKSADYGLSEFVKTADHILPLSRLIEKSGINLNLKSEKRDAVLYELAQSAREAGIAVSTDKLFEQLRRREEMLSTATGKGVAIPHPRNPSDDLFKKASVVIGRSRKGIDFASPDGKRVRLFFMTCAPDVVLHLSLLSKVARLLSAEGISRKFMDARSKDDVLKILLESERIKVSPA